MWVRKMMNTGFQSSERDRLMNLWPEAKGDERVKILARLVVLDEIDEEKRKPLSTQFHKRRKRISGSADGTGANTR